MAGIVSCAVEQRSVGKNASRLIQGKPHVGHLSFVIRHLSLKLGIRFESIHDHARKIRREISDARNDEAHHHDEGWKTRDDFLHVFGNRAFSEAGHFERHKSPAFVIRNFKFVILCLNFGGTLY